MTQLKNILAKSEEQIEVKPECRYRQVTVKLWGKGIILRNEVFGSEIAASKRHVLRCQEFLVSKIDARNGAFGLVPDSLDGAVVSSDFPVFKLDLTRIYPRFLEWISRTNRFIDICKASSEGTTNRVRLKEDRFLASEIPLPSLDKQRRIVARIEELAARIEEARELRRRAVEETDVLLYSAARKLRRKLLETETVKPVGEITVVTSGGTPDRSNPLYWNNGTIPWIKTGELFDGLIECSQERITEAGLNNSSAKIFPVDTVLIALYGQGQTRGRTGILKIPATTNQACAAILPQPEIFDSLYLQHWLRSLYHEMRLQNRAGAQPNWNSNMIKKIRLALPTISEQRRIVAYLDGLSAKLDALKRHQAQTAAELDALLPAVLERAFRGEL